MNEYLLGIIALDGGGGNTHSHKMLTHINEHTHIHKYLLGIIALDGGGNAVEHAALCLVIAGPHSSPNLYMHVCVCVCMYTCVYVCMLLSMLLFALSSLDPILPLTCTCMYVCVYVCIRVCMYACC